MEFKKSVSIIIPNFNGKNLLEKYLPYTLKAIESENVSFEIIVVDDSSADDSVDYLKQNYPKVVVLQNEINKGFAFTCNVGLQAAKYELSFFLNSDIKLEESYFSQQWKYFESEDTFGVMGRMLTPDGRIEGAAKIPKIRGLKLKVNKQYYNNIQNHYFTPTIFLSGANSLVVTKKAREINGFNEIFSPFYSEDVDLGLKAWRVGWKSYYEHKSICHHLGSHTIKNNCLKRQIKSIYFRNRMILHAIHMEKKNLSLWKIQLLLFEVFPKFLIGDFWIYRSFMDYRGKKEKIEKSRKSLKFLMEKHDQHTSLADLEKYFEKSLSLQNPTYL